MANWYKYENKENLLTLVDQQSMFRNKKASVFQQAQKRLSDLAKVLEAEEEKLYQSLNVKDLKELQSKLNEVNEDEGFRSFNNLPDSEFDSIVLAATAGLDLTKPITLTFEKDSKAKDLLLSLADEEGKGVMLDFLQKLRDNEGNNLKGAHLTGSRGVAKRLATYQINMKKDKLQLQVQLKEAVKKGELQTLASKLEATLEEEEDNLKTRIQRMMLDKIKTNKLRQLTEKEFKERGDWYDVNSSKASIKGYLGEIHANVAARYLFEKSNVYATGNIRDLKGQEIPIDLVIEGIGFQIKNYRIEKGQTLFRYGGKAGNFIENRVRPDQTLRDLLVTFFGVYQSLGEDTEFQSLAKQRLVEGGAIPTIFNAYMDNIMRISNIFGAKDNEQGLFLGEQSIYYNTFFLISNLLVPASAMVWAIHDELGEKMSTVYNTKWVFDDPISGEATSTESPNLLADKIGVELYLHLNVTNVLQYAQKRATQKGIDAK